MLVGCEQAISAKPIAQLQPPASDETPTFDTPQSNPPKETVTVPPPDPAPEIPGRYKAASAGAPAVPTGVVATYDETDVAVTWDAVTGAASYDVKWYLTGGSWETATTVTDLSTNSYSVSLGITGWHYFWVRAKNAAGSYSSWSSRALVYARLAVPTGVELTTSTTHITVIWDAVTGAVSYDVQWRHTDQTWTTVTALTSRSYSVSMDTKGWYYFRVRSVYATGNNSSWSAQPTILIEKCYDGSGMEETDYSYKPYETCPSANSWQSSYSCLIGGVPMLNVHSAAQCTWLRTGIDNPHSPKSGQCNDSRSDVTCVLYRFTSTTNTHWYIGQSCRPGNCTEKQVMDRRYNGGASGGTNGIRDRHKDRIIIAHLHAGSLFVEFAKAAMECFELLRYQASGPPLTNALTPSCLGSKRTPNTDSCPPGGTSRSSSGKCVCPNGDDPDNNWRCSTSGDEGDSSNGDDGNTGGSNNDPPGSSDPSDPPDRYCPILGTWVPESECDEASGNDDDEDAEEECNGRPPPSGCAEGYVWSDLSCECIKVNRY